MALKEMPKVGVEVRYLGGDNGELTEGLIYEVIDVDDDGDAMILDDNGDDWYLLEFDNFDYYELVTADTSEPQPDVLALIANLGSRLHDVETTLMPREYDEVGPAEPQSDAVNSPSHYKRGKFETIEVIEEITAGYSDGFVAHCAGTAVKYIARAPYKHATPTEDLRKAAKYLEFVIKRLEAEATE